MKTFTLTLRIPVTGKENFMDELEVFLAYLKSTKGRSKLTIKEYFYDIRTFYRFILIHKGIAEENEVDEHLDDITPTLLKSVVKKDIYQYISYLEFKLKNSNRTKYRKLSSLHTFFNYLKENQELISDNPLENIDMPKIEKRLPQYLTMKESKKLLETVLQYDQKNYYKWRDYTIILIFLNTGMRLSELSGMDVDHILENDTVRVIGKGNKERTVYLNPSCINALEKYLPMRNEFQPDKKNKALFLSMRKNRMNIRSIQHMIEKYILMAGFDPTKITTHKLRHTAATLMYKYGDGDLRALQELLGHVSVQTTEIYTHVENEDLRKTVLANPLSQLDVEENE